MGLFEQRGLQYGDTPAETYEEEPEEPESYQEYEENYQEDGSEPVSYTHLYSSQETRRIGEALIEKEIGSIPKEKVQQVIPDNLL